MRAQISTRDYEIISAYLDGQLSEADRSRLEERMRANSDLRNAMEEMGRTRALLRMAPRRRAPHNFTLTRSMVGQKPEARRGSFRLFPAFSFASAMATLALVFSLLFELSPMLSGSRTMAPAAAPASEGQTLQQGNTLSAQGNEEPTMTASSPGVQSLAPNAAAQPQATTESSGPAITWGFPQAQDNLPGMGGAVATGKGGGGGGGGSVYPGIGAGAPDGNIVIPPEGIESLPKTRAPMQGGSGQEDLQSSGVPTILGDGPILGAPKPDAAGKYLEPLPTPMPIQPTEPVLPTATSSDSQPSQEVTRAAQPAVSVVSPALIGVQIFLGALALVTALAAVWAWRTNR